MSRKAKKKQHAHMSSGLRDHYSELFTQMAILKFENTVTQLLYTVKNGELHDSLVWEFSLHPVIYNTHREFCYTISIHRVCLITPKGFLGNTSVNPQLKLSH